MVVGAIEVVPILDAIGLLADYGGVYPELFSGPSWRLPCTCFLVRSGGVTILVDTGVGPPGLWDWTAEDEGRLPGALDDAGIRLDDVDIVFLTHLHIDHLGWNTDLEGVAFFPRARYVVHGDALAFARTRPNLPHIRRCVESLVDRFETVTGDAEFSPGVIAFSAPGHYPGHMALRLTSEGQEALLLADVAVHPAMLDEPDLPYASDLDQAACAETRRALLPELVDRDVLVACGHYPGSGIGRVVTRAGRVVWEEAR